MGFNILTFLLIACILASLAAFNDEGLKSKWTYSPYNVKHNGEKWRTFSHLWIHADTTHLLFNMVSLYFLGDMLQFFLSFKFGSYLGQFHFFAIFMIGGLFATLIPYKRNQDNPTYRSLGASGAVSAVVFAMILWQPSLPLNIMFIPFSIPAWVFGLVYLAFEFFADKKGNTGIAHDAHIGGAFLGIIYILVIQPEKGMEFITHLIN